MPRLTVQQIADQADRIREDVVGLKGQVNDFGEDLHEIGTTLRARMERDRDDFTQLREELAGFHGRLEPLVSTLQADYPKFRDDFTALRSQFDLALAQTKWAIGVFTAVAITLVGFAMKVTWDASAIRRDVS